MTMSFEPREPQEEARFCHEHEAALTRLWAEGAKARGDEVRYREQMAHLARLEALPKLWESQAA